MALLDEEKNEGTSSLGRQAVSKLSRKVSTKVESDTAEGAAKELTEKELSKLSTGSAGEAAKSAHERAASDSVVNATNAAQKGISKAASSAVKSVRSAIGASKFAMTYVFKMLGVKGKAASIAAAVTSIVLTGTLFGGLLSDSGAVTASSIRLNDTVDYDNNVGNLQNSQVKGHALQLNSERIAEARKIYRYLRSLDYKEEAIAGILANAMGASNIEPTRYEGDDIWDHFGLLRHHHADWTAYTRYLCQLYKGESKDITYAYDTSFFKPRADVFKIEMDEQDLHYLIKEQEYFYHDDNKYIAGVIPKGDDFKALMGIGLWQWIGTRAENLLYFANCQKKPWDMDFDNNNDMVYETPLQIAYMYWENHADLNETAQRDWYGEKKTLVDRNNTYTVGSDGGKAINNDIESWRVEKAFEAETPARTVIQYFGLVIDYKEHDALIEMYQECTWKAHFEKNWYQGGLIGGRGLDPHDVFFKTYTVQMRPVIATVAFDPEKPDEAQKLDEVRALIASGKTSREIIETMRDEYEGTVYEGRMSYANNEIGESGRTNYVYDFIHDTEYSEELLTERPDQADTSGFDLPETGEMPDVASNPLYITTTAYWDWICDEDLYTGDRIILPARDITITASESTAADKEDPTLKDVIDNHDKYMDDDDFREKWEEYQNSLNNADQAQKDLDSLRKGRATLANKLSLYKYLDQYLNTYNAFLGDTAGIDYTGSGTFDLRGAGNTAALFDLFGMGSLMYTNATVTPGSASGSYDSYYNAYGIPSLSGTTPTNTIAKGSSALSSNGVTDPTSLSNFSAFRADLIKIAQDYKDDPAASVAALQDFINNNPYGIKPVSSENISALKAALQAEIDALEVDGHKVDEFTDANITAAEQAVNDAKAASNSLIAALINEYMEVQLRIYNTGFDVKPYYSAEAQSKSGGSTGDYGFISDVATAVYYYDHWHRLPQEEEPIVICEGHSCELDSAHSHGKVLAPINETTGVHDEDDDFGHQPGKDVCEDQHCVEDGTCHDGDHEPMYDDKDGCFTVTKTGSTETYDPKEPFDQKYLQPSIERGYNTWWWPYFLPGINSSLWTTSNCSDSWVTSSETVNVEDKDADGNPVVGEDGKPTTHEETKDTSHWEHTDHEGRTVPGTLRYIGLHHRYRIKWMNSDKAYDEINKAKDDGKNVEYVPNDKYGIYDYTPKPKATDFAGNIIGGGEYTYGSDLGARKKGTYDEDGNIEIDDTGKPAYELDADGHPIYEYITEHGEIQHQIDLDSEGTGGGSAGHAAKDEDGVYAYAEDGPLDVDIEEVPGNFYDNIDGKEGWNRFVTEAQAKADEAYLIYTVGQEEEADSKTWGEFDDVDEIFKDGDIYNSIYRRGGDTSYQDGEDIAYEFATWFYENWYDHQAHIEDLKQTQDYKNHTDCARYWYHLIISQEWRRDVEDEAVRTAYKDYLWSLLPDEAFATGDSAGMDLKTFIELDKKAKEEAKRNAAAAGSSDKDKKKKRDLLVSEDEAYTPVNSFQKLYNYGPNDIATFDSDKRNSLLGRALFNNDGIAEVAVGMSYPKGYDWYSIDDRLSRISDVEKFGPYEGFTEPALEAVKSGEVAEEDFKDYMLMEKCTQMYVAMHNLTDLHTRRFSDNGAAVCTAVRASGRDDWFPETVKDQCEYLYYRENPSEIAEHYKKYTRDTWDPYDKTQQALDARGNKAPCIESRWKFVGQLPCTGNTKEDGKNDYVIDYSELKPGDICISPNDVFIYVGADLVGTKFSGIAEYSGAKYAICRAHENMILDDEHFGEDPTKIRLYKKDGGGSGSSDEPGEWIPEGSGIYCTARLNGYDPDVMYALKHYTLENGDPLLSEDEMTWMAGGLVNDRINPMRLLADAEIEHKPYMVFRNINDDFELSKYYQNIKSNYGRYVYEQGSKKTESSHSVGSCFELLTLGYMLDLSEDEEGDGGEGGDPGTSGS